MKVNKTNKQSFNNGANKHKEISEMLLTFSFCPSVVCVRIGIATCTVAFFPSP